MIIYRAFRVKYVMKWRVSILSIFFITLLLEMIAPLSAGLFFHPDQGISEGGIHILLDRNQVRICPGETAVFNITVVNDNDYPVLINATVVVLERWRYSLEPEGVFLQPHTSSTMKLMIYSPDNVANGTVVKATIVYFAVSPNTGKSMGIPATTVETVVEKRKNQIDYIPYIIVASAGIGIIAFFITDKGKYLASLGLSPLYTRINRDKVLDNTLRQGIFHYIRTNPGSSFSDIRRGLSLNNGVLAHHLSTLEREHYIKSRKEGIYRRFYLRRENLPGLYLNSSQKSILRYLLRNPGASQSEIATALGLSRQTVNYHILSMEKMGAVKINRTGRRANCYPLVRPVYHSEQS